LYVLQTKLVSPNSQGNSRWTIVNPARAALFGAIGKDTYPKALQILRDGSGSPLADFPEAINLAERGLLVEARLQKPQEHTAFLHHYHRFVHNYHFHNYASDDRFRKDREQMQEYGKIQPPPPVYTQRPSDSAAFVLPAPAMEAEIVQSEIQLLSNLLSGTFRATGQIDGGDFGPWLRKASPSGGARHPTEAWVLVRGRADIPDGVYYFDPVSHALIWKERNTDESSETKQLLLVITARVERPMWRYRESRSFRAVMLDAGHCIETLNHLGSAYGWTIRGHDIPSTVLNTLDLQEMIICALAVGTSVPDSKPAYNSTGTSSGLVSNAIFRAAQDIQYKTNPFLWFSFHKGELLGTTSYPASHTITLSDDMLRVLNYAQVSKRGDRPSSVAEIASSLSVSPESVTILIELGFLLDQTSVRNLFADAKHWIDHGWYQNLLVYLEYRAAKRSQKQQTNPSLEKPWPTPKPAELWRVLSSRRKTTRAFLDTRIPREEFDRAISPCLIRLRAEPDITLFHLARQRNGRFDLERWDENQWAFIPVRSVDSALLADAAIGQRPIIQASNVFWFSMSIDDTNPEKYFNALLALGMLSQNLCIQCARLGLGIFITPASNDEKAAAIIQADSMATINYFAAVGYAARGIDNEK
jgi:SagB-type dehydrogenase family enzyme